MSKADDSPLKGRRIINTRPAGQGDSLMASLARDGADPVALPMLRIETVLRDEALSQAVAAHADAALWVFTSVNAVAPFADLPQPIRWPPGSRPLAGPLRPNWARWASTPGRRPTAVAPKTCWPIPAWAMSAASKSP